MESVAVIIPSYNGAHRLPTLLASLEEQDFKEFRIVVVLDGSTDDSCSVLKAYEQKFDLSIVEQSNRGRSAARNAGVAAGTADLLIFMDDDMRPTPNVISRHISQYKKAPRSATTGIVESKPYHQDSDFQNYFAQRSSNWFLPYRDQIVQMNHHNLFFSGANCSIPGHVFTEIGGFDERLRDAEDFEIATRMIDLDIPVFIDGHNISWHVDNKSLESYIIRQREYRKEWLNLAALKPRLISDYNRFTPGKPMGIRAAFFKLFAHKCWVNADQYWFIKRFPKKIRYKLYDYIIASLGRFHTEKELS